MSPETDAECPFRELTTKTTFRNNTRRCYPRGSAQLNHSSQMVATLVFLWSECPHITVSWCSVLFQSRSTFSIARQHQHDAAFIQLAVLFGNQSCFFLSFHKTGACCVNHPYCSFSGGFGENSSKITVWIAGYCTPWIDIKQYEKVMLFC